VCVVHALPENYREITIHGVPVNYCKKVNDMKFKKNCYEITVGELRTVIEESYLVITAKK
jgi:hypothetical protein